MPVEFVCDGCRKRQAGSFNRLGGAFLPPGWYQRSDDDGTQIACSRECIDKVAKETGKTDVVLPV